MGKKKGSKKKKTKTKAQKMAVANKAKYGGTAKAAAANKAAGRAAAKKRYQASQANKALAKAGGTSAQVAKDNKQYGNTVPAGSFGISKAGKAQAAANLAEKRLSAPGTYGTGMPSNPAYKGVGARDTGPVRYKNSDYLTATPYVNAFKRTFGPDATLQGNRFNPADRAAALGAGYTDSVIGVANFAKNRLVPFGKLAPNIPTLPKFKDANLEGLRNFGSVVIPGLQTFGAAQRLSKVGLGQEISQMKLPNKGKYAFSNEPGAFRPRLTKTGIEGVNPVTIASAFTPKMLATGPTAGGSAAILGTATALSAAQQAKATDTQTGGLNISSGGVDSGEAEGSGTGRTLTARFNKPGLDTLAGGLDFVTDDRFDFDNLGRGLFGYGAVTPNNVINDAMSIAQNKNLTVNDMGTFLNTVKDISTSDDKLGTVKNIISNEDTTNRLLGPVYDQLRNSEIVDSLATKKLGLPDNYGEQLDQTKGALETAYSKLGTDDKANRRIISDLFIGKNPNLNLLKRGAEQFTNQSGTIANYQDKTTLAKFQDSFKENSPMFKGLNKDERGIMGSLGNWRLSNLGTKIVGQNLEGTDNFADLASNIIDTAGTNKATQSFVKTVKGGAPTPKSIIEGVIPRFGSASAAGARDIQNSVMRNTGSNATTLAAATPTSVEEVLPLPTAATQTGTNSGTLAGIMQDAYQNQMSLYGMNPNYSANFRQPRFNRPRQRFRQVFNRGYF